jgi:hypothetical protein
MIDLESKKELLKAIEQCEMDRLNSHMKYRQDEGIEELQELLVETLKRPKDKNCDTCNKSITDLEYANRGGNCDTCQPSLL